MEEWKECKLSDIVEINPTESLKKGTVAKKIGMDVLQPYCRAIPSFSFEPYTGGTKFKNGDTIMARITPCLENGKTAMVNILDDNEIGFGSTEYIVFRAKNNITDPFFVYYLVTSDCIRNPAIKSMVGSSGRQRVQTDVVANLSVKLPPLPTQQKIAAILSSLDDKIELNNKINTNLEQQAQALFKNWFVDFEPFGGKMPEGWKVGKLGEFVEIKRGGSPRPIQKFLSDEGYRWLKISDVTSLSAPFVLNIAEHIKEEGLSKTVFLKAGSLVLSNSATPGIPKILDLDTCIHDGWLYFPKSQLSNEYLYLLFKEIRPQLINLGNGSIFTNLKTDILKNFEISLPSRETLSKFQSIIKPIFEKMLVTQREIKQLETLRDTLLPKLMKGEIEV